jgi:hypothetical protein
MTAVSVVRPERAGMASGVNSTFRQIGIATGIAALGSILAASLQGNLARDVASVPSLAGRAPQIVEQIRQGSVGQVIAAAPPAERGALAMAVRAAFASGMNELFIVTGVVALVGAAASIWLIRSRDLLAPEPTPVAAANEQEPCRADSDGTSARIAPMEPQ